MSTAVRSEIIETKNFTLGNVILDGDEFNSVTQELSAAVYEQLQAFDDNKDVIGMVLSSDREGFFSNGLNPLYMVNKTIDEKIDVFHTTFYMCRDMLALNKQVVSEINGHVNAAGGVLTLATDYRIMANIGRFSFTEVKVGLFMAPSLMRLVQRVIRPQNLRDAVIQGKGYKPAEAFEVGLIDELVETAADLRPRTLAYFKNIARIPLSALRYAKATLNQDIVEFFTDNTESDMDLFREIISLGEFDEYLSKLAKRLDISKT